MHVCALAKAQWGSALPFDDHFLFIQLVQQLSYQSDDLIPRTAGCAFSIGAVLRLQLGAFACTFGTDSNVYSNSHAKEQKSCSWPSG